MPSEAQLTEEERQAILISTQIQMKLGPCNNGRGRGKMGANPSVKYMQPLSSQRRTRSELEESSKQQLHRRLALYWMDPVLLLFSSLVKSLTSEFGQKNIKHGLDSTAALHSPAKIYNLNSTHWALGKVDNCSPIQNRTSTDKQINNSISGLEKHNSQHIYYSDHISE